MSEISPSALGEKFDADFQTKLDACTTPEAIKVLMHEHELARGLRVPDIIDHSLLLPVKTPQPRSFATTVVIDGTKHILESDSADGLVEAEINLYRKIFAQPAAGTAQPRDPATGQFRATAEQQRTAADDGAAEAARQANLRADMLAGKISVDEYAAQSGAIERALASAGIDPEALREVSNKQYQDSWADATQEFLSSSDWPGGEENMKMLGEKLIEMNATEKPSVQVLRRAYADLKASNRLVENAETTRERRLSEAKTPAEIREILGYQGSTALWGK